MEKEVIELYESKLSLIETERAIKMIKDTFESELSKQLNLLRVSAPLFVPAHTGLNDRLSGIERPVQFVKEGVTLEIVQSLAKWKRLALYRYGMTENQGIYTDMNAIRQDETLSPLHSLYVDQWDWEKVISEKNRNLETLKKTVEKIYHALKTVDHLVSESYPWLSSKLPEEITFIIASDLAKIYPGITPNEREHAIARKHRAVFIIGIGDKDENGERHDARSPDYDDWSLNGDLILWNQTLECAFELSSMGIRVDANTLSIQLEKAKQLDQADLYYHRLVREGVLPDTVGGGIGQSRMCMFFLEKMHIGEVQSSFWPEEIVESCNTNKIFLL